LARNTFGILICIRKVTW